MTVLGLFMEITYQHPTDSLVHCHRLLQVHQCWTYAWIVRNPLKSWLRVLQAQIVKSTIKHLKYLFISGGIHHFRITINFSIDDPWWQDQCTWTMNTKTKYLWVYFFLSLYLLQMSLTTIGCVKIEWNLKSTFAVAISATAVNGFFYI